MPDRIESFSECLQAARRLGRPLDCADPPLSIDEAYAIQARVASGISVSGFKTARKEGQKQTMAPIFSRDTYHSSACTRIDFHDRIGIELEVGIKIVGPLPPSGSPGFEARAAGCVRPFVAIELVKPRLCGGKENIELTKLADNQINDGIIIGPDKLEWNGEKIDNVNAAITIGQRSLLDGESQVPGGSAMRAFTNLAQMANNHCGGLEAGQFVITGSLHPLEYIEQSTPVHASIDGFGSMDIDLMKA